MENIPWTSGVTIKDKDEERTEKVLKAIKERDDKLISLKSYDISSYDSFTSTLKIIYWILIFSTIITIFTTGLAVLIIYIVYRLFG